MASEELHGQVTIHEKDADGSRYCYGSPRAGSHFLSSFLRYPGNVFTCLRNKIHVLSCFDEVLFILCPIFV